MEKRSLYVDALLCEWQDRQNELHEPIQTLYIGGGTPSTLDLADLNRIIHTILPTSTPPLLHIYSTSTPSLLHHYSPEITLEVNPGDVTPEKAQAWRNMGINRLSMGVQSFDDTLLQLIGRRHTTQQAREAVVTAQAAGFDNISIDLMYALPSQTIQQWRKDVAQALQLGVQHISTYGLIYEEGTHLTNLLEQGIIEAVDEDTELQMYDYLVEQLTMNGFVHYEVSNFSLPGRQSQHNSSYWNNTPYLGLGAGAHSYDGNARTWNVSNLDEYIQQAINHRLQPEKEELTDEDKHTERVMLGLRTNQGVSVEDVQLDKAQPYLQQRLLKQEGNRLIATTQGWHILNRIIEDLI